MSEVTLVSIDLHHADRMLHWMQDESVSANIGLRHQPTLERTTAWIRDAMHREDMAAFAILNEGLHVGNVVLDQIDTLVRTARLSIYLGEHQARGRGVGRLALSLILEHAFGRLRLQKVWLTVHVRNTAAITSYVRNGFSVEGVQRRSFFLNGEVVDALCMGILQEEFVARHERR